MRCPLALVPVLMCVCRTCVYQQCETVGLSCEFNIQHARKFRWRRRSFHFLSWKCQLLGRPLPWQMQPLGMFGSLFLAEPLDRKRAVHLGTKKTSTRTFCLQSTRTEASPRFVLRLSSQLVSGDSDSATEACKPLGLGHGVYKELALVLRPMIMKD